MTKKLLHVLLMGSLTLVPHPNNADADERAGLLPQVTAYVKSRCSEFEQIPSERRAHLEELARYVKLGRSAREPVKLIFICTHNSRRSHLSQLWASAAAAHYRIKGVECYSGGTERTAFNSRAIVALERAGFVIEQGAAHPNNPHYKVVFASGMEPLVCYSKAYDSEPNPTSNFCAVMTCSHADTNCPIVRGASHRVRLTYEDPKIADGTHEEARTYDERCAQIAREMLFAFSLAE